MQAATCRGFGERRQWYGHNKAEVARRIFGELSAEEAKDHGIEVEEENCVVRAMGYTVNAAILDAAAAGVPQRRRRRLYVVARRGAGNRVVADLAVTQKKT